MEIASLMKIVCSPYGVLTACFVILLMGRLLFKRRYMDCFGIIKKHLSCFRKGNGKLSRMSIFMYFIVPLFLATAVLRLRNIDTDVINLLTIIVTILTTMFFTLLTLILDMRAKVKGSKEYDAGDAALSLKLLKEVYYSIMFEILLSVVILIMCFVELFAKQFYWLCGLVIYYMSFVLLTNLFMVLKRIFKVIDRDLENS